MIENKDQPINPMRGINGQLFNNGSENKSFIEQVKPLIGLTKREYFAAMAMQGLLANSEFLKNHKDMDIHILSVKNADYLLKQLEL